jgi:hypothetical protein
MPESGGNVGGEVKAVLLPVARSRLGKLAGWHRLLRR